MQQFEDHTDFNHLINTLSQDFNLLFNRIKKIEQRVKSAYGNIKKNDFSGNNEIWISPVSKKKWSIHYVHSVNNKKIDIHFYPYTEFLSGEEKVFLVLSKKDQYKVFSSRLTSLRKNNDLHNKVSFKDFVLNNNLVLLLFREHFFDQFRARANYPDFSDFQVIQEFSMNINLVLVENFQQNIKWIMCLHSRGVAMTKFQENYIVFDTFVAKDQLFENQITAISNHLSALDDDIYGAVSLLMLRSGLWQEFIDKRRLLSWLIKLALKDQAVAKSLIDEFYPILNNLFTQPVIKNGLDQN